MTWIALLLVREALEVKQRKATLVGAQGALQSPTGSIFPRIRAKTFHTCLSEVTEHEAFSRVVWCVRNVEYMSESNGACSLN